MLEMTTNPSSSENPPTGTNTQAFSYARFSDKRQSAGDSITRQRSKARVYAALKGYILHELPADEGVSAHHGRNSLTGHLADFIAKARNAEIPIGSTLLVENLDRLSRERLARAATMLLELVEDCGVNVVTLHNEKVYHSPMGLVDAVQALLEIDLAHQESVKKGERVKAAWKRARESGQILHNHNLAPGWLQKNNEKKIWEIIPEKEKLVVRIFEFLANHNGGGMYQLAGILNEEGVPPLNEHRRNPAKGWHASAIDKLRLSRSVLGEFCPCTVEFVEGRRIRKVIEKPRANYFPTIITEDLWARAQRPNNARRAGRPSLTTKNLFRGIVWSEVDGTRMIHRGHGEKTKSGRGISYLVSAATVMKHSAHRIRYELFEQRLVWFLKSLKPDLFITRAAVRTDKHAAERIQLEQSLRQAQRAHENLLQIIEAAEDLTEIVPRIRERKAKINEINARLNEINRPCAPTLAPLALHDLATSDGREKARHEVAALIDRIWVSADGAQVRFESPHWLHGLNADLTNGTFDFGHEIAG